jgi:hypothetical protein
MATPLFKAFHSRLQIGEFVGYDSFIVVSATVRG